MRLALIIGAALALSTTAAASVLPPPTGGPAHGCGRTAIGTFVACPAAPVWTPAPSSSFMCRVLDANEQPQAILDSEILSTKKGTRSLSQGWKPAAYAGGKFVCLPVVGATGWTDDSLSVYDHPNTAYANPLG